MKQFKKTTKTDKNVCVSSRVQYIFERIKTYDDLYYFIQNVVNNNHHVLLGGRSITSLIAPLINDSQSRKQFYGFGGYSQNTYIELKSYGIRVIVKGKRSCVTFGNLFNKIFKVSTVSILENGNYSFVIKHEPSTGNELELTNKEQNAIDAVHIKDEQSKLEIERKRLDQERRMLYIKLNEIESQIDTVKVQMSKNRTKLDSFSLSFSLRFY